MNHSDPLTDSKSEEARPLLAHFVDMVMEQFSEPKGDMKATLSKALTAAVSRLDLVTSEELEQQKTLLRAAQSEIEELKRRLAALDA